MTADLMGTVPTEISEASETVRCPTCRAQQVWSDECRRCGSDLSLLRQFAARVRWHRRLCLLALHEQRFHDALTHAEQLHALRPDDASERLRAVCLLRSGQFEAI